MDTQWDAGRLIALQTAAGNRLGSRNVGAPHTACAVRQGTVNSRRTRRRMTSSGRATVPGSASRATRGPSCPQRRENATLPNPLHPAHPLRTCLDAPRLDQGAYSQLPASHSHRLPSRRAPSTSWTPGTARMTFGAAKGRPDALGTSKDRTVRDWVVSAAATLDARKMAAKTTRLTSWGAHRCEVGRLRERTDGRG